MEVICVQDHQVKYVFHGLWSKRPNNTNLELRCQDSQMVCIIKPKTRRNTNSMLAITKIKIKKMWCSVLKAAWWGRRWLGSVSERLPLFAQVGTVQNGRGNPRPIDRRVGIHGANQDLQLWLYPFGFISVFADHSEGSHTLTWKEKVHLVFQVWLKC